MSRLFLLALFFFASAIALPAQDQQVSAPATQQNAAKDFVPPLAAASVAAPSPFAANGASNFLLASAVPDSVSPSASFFGGEAVAAPADAVPPPVPDPKFVYGSREDYRWELSVGVSMVRFRSSIFSATAPGISTSVSYFTNEWLAVEGEVTTAFSPALPHTNETVKYAGYGGGPKIQWREHLWEPWMHAIVGGAHILPQTAASGQNAFLIQGGGGVDYRFSPQLSIKAEIDYVRTSFFKASQNNAQAVLGIVFHF